MLITPVTWGIGNWIAVAFIVIGSIAWIVLSIYQRKKR
jgi:hypothetical protein